MSVTATEVGDVWVVIVDEDRLDRNNRSRFEASMAPYLRPGVKIALGLNNVRYMDGPGYSAMLSLREKSTRLGGDVRVFSLRQSVRTLYQQLRLHRKVHTFNVLEEAVRSFEGEA